MEEETELAHFLVSSLASIDIRPPAGADESIPRPVLSDALSDTFGIGTWSGMPPRIRDLELRRSAALRRRWGAFKAQGAGEAEREKKGDGGIEARLEEYLPGLVRRFLAALESVVLDSKSTVIAAPRVESMEEDVDDASVDSGSSSEEETPAHGNVQGQSVALPPPTDVSRACPTDGPPSRNLRPVFAFINRSLELFVDLLSFPESRRFVRPLLLSLNVYVRCLLSTVATDPTLSLTPPGRLFGQLCAALGECELPTSRDVDSSAGASSAGTGGVGAAAARERAHVLQKLCHRRYPEAMSDVVYAGVNMVGDAAFLRRNLDALDEDTLADLSRRLRLVDGGGDREGKESRDLITSILLRHHASPPSEVQLLSRLPLYPDETLLWNPHLVPPGHIGRNADPVLALPKLNLQFLTYADYLLRSFKLFRLESAYGIRSDLVDVIRRLRPAVKQSYGSAEYGGEYTLEAKDEEDAAAEDTVFERTQFQGWAKMGLELSEPVRLLRVSPPKLGQTAPAEVVAEIVVNLKPLGESLRREWEEGVGEFDNLFLVGVDAARMTGEGAPEEPSGAHGGGGAMGRDGSARRVPDEEDVTFPRRYGVTAVRGCMVLEIHDEAGNIYTDSALGWRAPEEGERKGFEGGKKRGEKKKRGGSGYVAERETVQPKGMKRYLRVALDPAQYEADAMGRGSGMGTRVYQTLNMIVRRHGRENNFKSTLETIRGLMTGAGSIARSIPPWLHSVLLGYGDPTSACYSSREMRAFATRTAGVTPPDAALDYGDTFLDEMHLHESFPGCDVVINAKSQKENKVVEARVDADVEVRKKYRIKVTDETNSGGFSGDSIQVGAKPKVEATPYPFPQDYPGNPVRFTPRQVSAIRSGLSPGLTLVVGPPGTGKTDVAVQIVANLYHSFPTQRTVLVTHSNAALNDLFQKVMIRGDVDERYMLRLGSGERDLKTETEHDFTKTGRVAHILSRRALLLEKVQQMSESLGVSGRAERGTDGSPSYTCETSEYFRLHHIQKRFQIFESKVNLLEGKYGEEANKMNLEAIFPFRKYFGWDITANSHMTIKDAQDKFAELDTIFNELSEYRPLELLRSQRQRTNYLLTKQARIVAMTCTHASIVRSRLVELGFQYDNLLVEEAGQMLDVETFIPLLLQRGEADADIKSSLGKSTTSRLKRVCLIGDHHQLPPVVKNMSFSRFSNLDQSLFSRLIRLSVPTIDLNKQGRARADIARLYNWRYSDLGNLDHVSTKKEFQMANAGFLNTFQMINVDEFEGQGESTPTAYFYQNIGEAEYAVALFQYMVLIGYPPQKISILTTYNGQKDLLLDILSQRCGPGTPLAGIRPGAVSTVDHYQGQQNDYILLSLVRTRAVGHLRDIRRLVVAVSRARLGLYVFCRPALFESCHELQRTMRQLAERPHKLELVRGERYPSERRLEDNVPEEKTFIVDDVAALGQIVYSMQDTLCVSDNHQS